MHRVPSFSGKLVLRSARPLVLYALLLATVNCNGTKANVRPVKIEEIVSAVHEMLTNNEVRDALNKLGVSIKDVTLDLHTATTKSNDVSVTFVGSLEGELDVTNVQELTMKFQRPAPKKQAYLLGKIPGAKDLMNQLTLASKAAAAANGDPNDPLSTKSIEVEFDFTITLNAAGGIDFKLFGVEFKDKASVKKEETQKLVLSFEPPSKEAPK